MYISINNVGTHIIMGALKQSANPQQKAALLLYQPINLASLCKNTAIHAVLDIMIKIKMFRDLKAQAVGQECPSSIGLEMVKLVLAIERCIFLV